MAPAIALVPHTEGVSEPVVTQIAAEDKVKWYKKPNLRFMYFCLFACCMGVEMTSGFDSQLINTLQFSGPWNACGIFPPLPFIAMLKFSRFLRRKQRY
jgi:hypothetical protein